MLRANGFLTGPGRRRGSSPCSGPRRPRRARLRARDPRPAPLRSRRQPRKGAKPPAPKVLLAAVCIPLPRPGLRQPVVRDRDPGRTARRLPPRAPQVPRRCRPAARGGRRAPTSGRLPTWAAGAARLRSRRRQSPAGLVRRASALAATRPAASSPAARLSAPTARALPGPAPLPRPRPRAYLEPAPGASAAAAPGAPTIRAFGPRSTLSPVARRAPPRPGRGSRAPRGLPGATAAAGGRARTPAAAPGPPRRRRPGPC